MVNEGIEYALTESLPARLPASAASYAGDKMVTSQLLNKKQVARLLNVSQRSVDNWMKRGWLPYLKIGRSVRFNGAHVLQHLDDTALVDHGGCCRVHVY